MTDKNIIKLASKLAESLATKGDVHAIKTDIREVKDDIKRLEGRIDGVNVRLGRKMDEADRNLGSKIDELDEKADTILEFAEAVDEITAAHERRLKRIEAVPVIAHQIKK